MLATLVSLARLLFSAYGPNEPSTPLHRHECLLCQLVRSAPGTDYTAAAHSNGAQAASFSFGMPTSPMTLITLTCPPLA